MLNILLLLSYFLAFSKSNLRLLLILLGQTLRLFILALTSCRSSWLAWLLLLVFLGGVLVSFSYVVISTPDQPQSTGSYLYGLGLIRLGVSLIFKGVVMSLPAPLGSFNWSWGLLPRGLSYMPLFIILYLLILLLTVESLCSLSKGAIRAELSYQISVLARLVSIQQVFLIAELAWQSLCARVKSWRPTLTATEKWMTFLNLI